MKLKARLLLRDKVCLIGLLLVGLFGTSSCIRTLDPGAVSLSQNVIRLDGDDLVTSSFFGSTPAGINNLQVVGSTAMVFENKTFDVDDNVFIIHHLKISELATDPTAPAEGEAVIWMSNGVGSGSDGDIMISIQANSVTKTFVFIDFSAAEAL